MSESDRFIDNAGNYAERFDKADLSPLPSKRVAVLACMDTRLIPSRILGLNEGEAHILRNAGGVVTDDAIRSLSLSQNLLGTEEIILLHHTECGMLTFTDEEYADRMEAETGERPTWSAQAFSDLDQEVCASIARLRESPFIPEKDSIRGFVFDVKTGELREVSTALELFLDLLGRPRSADPALGEPFGDVRRRVAVLEAVHEPPYSGVGAIRVADGCGPRHRLRDRGDFRSIAASHCRGLGTCPSSPGIDSGGGPDRPRSPSGSGASFGGLSRSGPWRSGFVLSASGSAPSGLSSV